MSLKISALGATALTLLATSALSGGIERAVPSSRVLFEDGRYFELSATFASPDVSGTGGAVPPGGDTGDLLETFATLGAAYKADINENLSYALFLDQPWGVDTSYPTLATSGYSGTVATLDAIALTGVLAYDFNPNVKAYAGLRLQSVEAEAEFGFLPAPYAVTADRDYGVGYMFGAAYQRPDIALRVALTYYSEIEHTLDTSETFGPGSLDQTTDINTPQAINLEFQTGVAADTLVFGSIRWVDWSEFAIEPPLFVANVGAPLVDYEKDWTTYTLGVGRRFSDEWSGAVQVSYEPATDTTLTTLGPIDGRTSLGLAATHTRDNMKITGGVQYIMLGDATNFAGTEYNDNTAIAAGLRVGWSF